MSEHLSSLLERRVRTDPARPLLVWYGADDARVELSAVTFANWVDKTVNLLGELGLDEAPVVSAPLVARHPGHWTSLVWCAAVWSLGGELRVEQQVPDVGVDLALLGPDDVRPVLGVDTVACSLHPLGLALPSVPAGVIDYADVLAQPDVHTPALPPDPAAVAWRDEQQVLTHADLAELSGGAGRVALAVDALAPVVVVRRAFVEPLVGGGSSVVVEGDPGRLAAIADAELARVEA